MMVLAQYEGEHFLVDPETANVEVLEINDAIIMKITDAKKKAHCLVFDDCNEAITWTAKELGLALLKLSDKWTTKGMGGPALNKET